MYIVILILLILLIILLFFIWKQNNNKQQLPNSAAYTYHFRVTFLAIGFKRLTTLAPAQCTTLLWEVTPCSPRLRARSVNLWCPLVCRSATIASATALYMGTFFAAVAVALR